MLIEKTQTMDEPVEQKFFTLADANASLVYVSRVVQDIALQHKIVTELIRNNQQEEKCELFEAGVDILNELIEELALAGATLTDFASGGIMFHGVYDGRYVEFQWKLGQARVRAYIAEGSRHQRELP